MAIFIGHDKGKIRVVSFGEVPPKSSEITFIRYKTFWPCCRYRFNAERVIEKFKVVHGKLVKKTKKKQASEMKAAFVGVYKTECGIATYSEWLWFEMAKHFKETKIFCEYDSPESPGAIRCWSRGKAIAHLIDELEEYDPDIIYIQHEFGIFPNAAKWLSLLSRLSHKPIVVTFHSTFEHQDKTVCEAAVPNLIVHTYEAKRCLQGKGVNGKIFVIPHGSHEPDSQEKLWNIYRTTKTLIQYGFLFRYKNFEESLRVVAELKKKHPDVFFTGLLSEAKGAKAESDFLFNKLQAIVKELGIEDNVGFVRKFQSEASLESYLRTSSVAIFPYFSPLEHRVYASSGAARLAMKYGIPCVVSKMNHFSDLEGVCPRAGSTVEYAQIIESLFDKKQAIAQVKRQNEFLKKTSWKKVAEQYVQVSREI